MMQYLRDNLRLSSDECTADSLKVGIHIFHLPQRTPESEGQVGAIITSAYTVERLSKQLFCRCT